MKANPFFRAQLIFKWLLPLSPPPLQCDSLRAGGEAERMQLDQFIDVEFLDQMLRRLDNSESPGGGGEGFVSSVYLPPSDHSD
ncbi:hypothetical protein VULLAG_LOCUS16907 [Vulpes lagopus]